MLEAKDETMSRATLATSRQRVGGCDVFATAKLQVIEAADVATRAVSRGALLAILARLPGALASRFGGRTGTVDHIITARLVSRGVSPAVSS